MNNKAKIFICAASEDLKIAKRLYNDLKSSGITPWMESEDLLSGQDMKLTVRQEIKKAGYFLALLSSKSLSKRGDVQKQLKIALDILDEFPPDQIFVIPVRIDECEPADERLQNRKSVDLFLSYQEGFRQIIRVFQQSHTVSDISPVKDQPSENKETDPMPPDSPPKLRHQNSLIPAFAVLILLIATMVGIGYIARNPLFTLLVRYSKDFGTFIIYTGFVGVSLIAAVVMFGIMRSTGVFRKTGKQEKYEFGGAMSGFFVVLVFLIGTYSNYTSSATEIKITVNVRFVENGKPVGPVSDALVSIAGSPGHKNNTDKDGNIILTLPEDQKLQDIELQVTYKEQPTLYRKVPRSDLDKVIVIEIPKSSDNLNSKGIPDIETVKIQGGCFMMGCDNNDKDCKEYEKPSHEVCLDTFWIGKYEITQGQWNSVMTENPSSFKKGDNYPVENVSLTKVREFINKFNELYKDKKVSFRLPTEAEWEYVCQKGFGIKKGINLREIAWYSESSSNSDSTHPVGQEISPNNFGVYDMLGNVWEWCDDSYDSEAYKNFTNDKKHSPKTSEPKTQGGKNVIRGGGYNNPSSFLRCTYRRSQDATDASKEVGFRIVKQGE